MKVSTVFRFGLVTALLLAATGICLAVPNTFKQGDVVSSAQMNQNFADLEAKVASSRVATIGTVSYSVGPTSYCGSSSPMKGNFGPIGTGYVVAKQTCEAACKGSKTAHMCSSEEVVRIKQMGGAVGAGWVSSGISVATPGPGGVSNDCFGWSEGVGTKAGVQQFGCAWQGDFMNYPGCDNAMPIVCCD